MPSKNMLYSLFFVKELWINDGNSKNKYLAQYNAWKMEPI